MKNIHILPTDKPSRLHFDDKLFLSTRYQLSSSINSIVKGKNIYITNDEEIKEGDWGYISFEGGTVKRIGKYFADDWKKIILTTDQGLIKDGVQAIDDEFLEWFVKNSSCEFVEVVDDWNSPRIDAYEYKIIISKEEIKIPQIGTTVFNDLASACFGGKPKQETLEEVASTLAIENVKEYMKTFPSCDNTFDYRKGFEDGFVKHAKWQQEKDKDFYFKYIKSEMDFQKPRIAKLGISTTAQIFEQQVTSLIHLAERSYSEEEVKEQLNLILAMKNSLLDTFTDDEGFITDEWFEQFKKK